MTLIQELQQELENWKAAGLERRLRNTDFSSGSRIKINGRPVLSLGSNNYLGLADHPDVCAAAVAAIQRVGMGAGASRLVTGNFPEHQTLEQTLAEWRRAEDAVLFDSGYACNTGVIPALAGRNDLVLSDALNHASLIDGCRLSRAEVRVYPHVDTAAAREMLGDRSQFRRCLIVTDGVFSMDGDLAPLPDLCDLADERDAWLVVDDAHGVGVLGEEGRGTAALLGVEDRVPVLVGTLSKALGAAGGFVTGRRVLCDLLRQRARSFVFSTAMPPAVAAGAEAAVALARHGDSLRCQLHDNARQIGAIFRSAGFQVPDGAAAIIPVLVGDERAAIDLSARLLEQGVLAPAIRYPTVPRGQARLRVTASAALTSADLELLARALQAATRP